MKIVKDEKINLGSSYVGIISFFVLLIIALIAGLNISEPFINNYTGLKDYNISITAVVITVVFSVLTLIALFSSFIVISPNEKYVVSFLGKYRGTVDDEGVSMINPFFSFHKVDAKIRSFETKTAKINDKEGIPLDVSLVVNFKVEHAAPYFYNVINPNEFIINICESELRKIVTHHSFDSDNPEEDTLIKNLDNFSEELARNINSKVKEIGLIVLSSTISKMSYAKEIAQSMLQRQQAKKVGESRKEIVNAAVSTVRDAVTNLEQELKVQFTDPEKKDLLKKLMVVIVSDKETTPVVSLD